MSPGGARLKDEGSRLQVVSAGAVAGLVSRFVIAPLDVVKIRLQLQPHSLSDPLNHFRNAPAYRGTIATARHILRHEGVTALWKGNVPAELLYVCYASIQFGTYRSVSALLQDAAPALLPSGRRLPDAAESFISGASAGAIATTVTYPLDLLRTRFAAQGRRKVYRSLWSAVTVIRRDEGALGFFRGLGPGLAGIAPYMGIFFAAYEQLRLASAELDLPWGSGEATAGVVASVVAKTAVFPLDLVRKRIQIQGPARDMYAHGRMPEYRSAIHALRSIVLAEGFRGLFKGLPISLIKAAPGSAITVWTYERALHFAMSLERGREDVAV